MKNSKITATVLTMLLLTACGHTTGDRALSGAGIGAGVGAIGSTIVGGDPVTGAVVGGIAGGATGALTKDKDVNLGTPLWRR